VLECDEIIEIYQQLSSDKIKQDFEHILEKSKKQKNYNLDNEIEVLRRDFKILVEEILENNVVLKNTWQNYDYSNNL